jgi:flagellar motor switch protein FliN/FliY
MSHEPGNLVHPPLRDGLDKLRELLAKHLGVALTSMLGEGVETVDIPIEAASNLFWFRQTFAPLDGSLWFGITKPEVVFTGAKLLAAAGLTDEPPETAIQTFGEILSQACGALALEYAAKLRKDVRTAALECEVTGEPEAEAQFVLKVSAGVDVFLLLILVEGVDLLSPLAPPTPPQSAAIAPAVPVLAPANLEGVNTKNLDLLLDVELPISVSFGRAQLALKDVIKLTTGSIVELNRAVSEPVDIIVNNCVIARGEVVVVEGNFGVRIKQIVSKQDRLKTVT